MPNAPKLPPRPPPTAPDRGSTTERGYGTAHQKARAELLRRIPICQRCGVAWSRHMHHRDRNTSNRRPENLEALCERCHQAEHQAR